jgi:triacylglycerol lipase
LETKLVKFAEQQLTQRRIFLEKTVAIRLSKTLKQFAGSVFITLLAACSSAPKPPTAPTPATPKPVTAPAAPAIVSNAKAAELPPIIFVHGNGDTAALWTTTIWRFETNGWPRNRLFAIDFRYPQARTDDGVAQEGRSSSADQLNELAAEVARVRQVTGAARVILIGNSRGGYAIRNYIRNGTGRNTVLAAVMGGTPNHGVWRSATFNPQSEFNGMGRFLTALNSPQSPDGAEVTPGVFFATTLSDNNDKFAQPDGRWIGQAGTPTGVTFESPALRGASNIVLPKRDHRETSFHPEAFAATYKFLTGNAPSRTTIAREEQPVLNGVIAALSNGSSGELTNLPLANARVSVYNVNAQTGERLGGAIHQKTVGQNGLWGPFQARSDASYEFVIEASGFATTHIYRSPFARSSDIINMRPVKLADSDKDGASVVTMTRPRGYFGVGRDRMSLDGISPPPGIAAGVAGLSSSKIKVMTPGYRTVIAEFNQEKIAVRTWSAKDNRVVIAEFHD